MIRRKLSKLRKPQATLFDTVIHDVRDPHQAAENHKVRLKRPRSIHTKCVIQTCFKIRVQSSDFTPATNLMT